MIKMKNTILIIALTIMTTGCVTSEHLRRDVNNFQKENELRSSGNTESYKYYKEMKESSNDSFFIIEDSKDEHEKKQNRISPGR